MPNADDLERSLSALTDTLSRASAEQFSAALDAWLTEHGEHLLAVSVKALREQEIPTAPDDPSEIGEWLCDLDSTIEDTFDGLPWVLRLALGHRGPRFLLDVEDRVLSGPKASALAARIAKAMKIPTSAFAEAIAHVSKKKRSPGLLVYIDLSELLRRERRDEDEDDYDNELTGPRPDLSASPWDKLQWLGENHPLVEGAEDEIDALFAAHRDEILPSEIERVGAPDPELWPNQPHRITKSSWRAWLSALDESLDLTNSELWQTGLTLQLVFDQKPNRLGPRFQLIDEMDREVGGDAARAIGEALCRKIDLPFDALHAAFGLFGKGMVAMTRRCGYLRLE